MNRFYLLWIPVVTSFVLPMVAEDSVPTGIQVEELRLVARKLAVDNTELQSRLQEMESVRKLLLENSAITQTEAKLVEQHSRDVELKAEASGLPLLTADEQKLQSQLLESVRALHHAEEVQQKLISQNQRLVTLIEELIGAGPSLDVSQKARLLVEIEASKRLNEAVRNEKLGLGVPVAGVETGNLKSAKVRDVNDGLHLVVLNIGTAQGVRIGMPFLICRGEQPVALVRAADVRETMTGALVERIEKNTRPQIGDAASVVTQ